MLSVGRVLTTKKRPESIRCQLDSPPIRELRREVLKTITRRQLFRQCSTGMGAIALASLMNENLFAGPARAPGITKRADPLALKPPHFKPRAKNIIYLHMAGAPSQLDLFDPKPKLNEFDGQPIPESLTKGERFAFIKGTPKILGSPYQFGRYGKSGTDPLRIAAEPGDHCR